MVATASVTFLFTDIEGSTRLWESEPARMTEALARHDRLCRTAVEAHGGRLVKMIGDGLHAVFDDPADAVASTLDLQRGMAAIADDCGLALKMRCGLHAGVSELRDGDYFGSAVNRAARIAGAAHGGQILLSQAVVDLGKARLADSVEVIPLGRVRLRDLSAPENIWQVASADLPRTFPALRSLDSTPNNLPQQVTSFIGREKEIADIKERLRTMRLVTLTGSGGCGKTRLALQVAADALDRFPDGVWLAELAALTDPAHVSQVVAFVLGLKEEPGRPLTQTLVEHLKSRHLLLVLDNAEHLLAPCAELATAVLRQCPQAFLLVTSREGLGLTGELTLRVPSLSMPDPKHDASSDAVARYESTRLFVERVRASVPGFALTEQNARVLASICYRLDGIPLALELAAARVRSLPLEEVHARLDERFRLLTGGSRTALPRQQTLRSLIDWSYDLLREPERMLLRRLAVFAGGFTLEAAEQVCSDDAIDDMTVVDLVASLTDKSLVAADASDGTMRYRMLETIRQYARERLFERDNGSLWRGRHLAYYCALAAEAQTRLVGPEQKTWLERLENEHDNMRAALAWSSADGGDTATGLKLAGSIWRFWHMRAYMTEGRNWLTTLLSADRGGDPRASAQALTGAGILAWQQTDLAASRAAHTEALALYRELGDRQGIARALANLGNVAYTACDYPSARALVEESLTIRRDIGDQQGVADASINLGGIAYETGDYDAARRYYQEALAYRRAQGDRWHVALTLNNLGAVADAQADYATCLALYEESLAILRELGDRWGIPTTLSNMGELAYAQGDHATARRLHEESLALRRDSGDRHGVAAQLNNLCKVELALGNRERACSLSRESLPILREIGDLRGMAELLESVAVIALQDGAAGRSARLWSAAERLRAEINFPLRPKELPEYERQVAAVRAACGDESVFQKAWEEGRAMSVEQAVEYALER